MFYRCKFVTNSSSSSYIGWGFKLNKEEIDKLTDEQHDDLYDTWNDGPQKITFVWNDSGLYALVCLVARYSDEDFVHFLTEEQGAHKLTALTALERVLKKFGLTPIGQPVWVFSHKYS
jgi:hypothetical protein